MGKKIKMARSEEEGQSVLLAVSGDGERISTSRGGNKRKEEISTAKASKRRKVQDTKTTSKISSENKGTDARPRQEGCRRSHKNRKQNRRYEGEDRVPRRSASELEIKHPGSYCDDNQLHPHYWYEADQIDGGILFRCIYCHDYLWLPLTTSGVERLHYLISKYGKDEGYCRYLDYHRQAKLVVAKMQHLRELSKDMTDHREFARLASEILDDKEYDRYE